MQYETILVDVADHIATITINRPAQRNAVNGAVSYGVCAAVDELDQRDDLRVGILTGAGGADRFVFTGRFGRDTITDFQTGADKIVLDDDIFTALGITGIADMGTTIDDWQAYRRAGDEQRLYVRIMAYAGGIDAMVAIAREIAAIPWNVLRALWSRPS